MDTPTLIHATLAALATFLGGACLGAAEVLRRQAKQDLVEAWSLATPAQRAAALAALPAMP